MVTAQAGCFIDRARIDTTKKGIAFGADDKEGARLRQAIKPHEIEKTAIHDGEAARLRRNHVKHVDFMHFAVRNMDERRDITAQVDLRVHLHGSLGGAEMRPWKELERQVDRGRVERVDRVGEFNTEVIVSIETTCLGNQGIGEVAINAPVALLVGVGKIAAGDMAANSKMIKFCILCAQTDFKVAQALTER